MMGIEPMTSSLPRKRSTPELHRLVIFQLNPVDLSGRRGSNSRPTAWKAVALPTELLPLANLTSANRFLHCLPFYQQKWWGEEDSNLRTRRNRFTVCRVWPLRYLPLYLLPSQWRDSNPRPADYKSAALAN
jgi:hypothetical protein